MFARRKDRRYKKRFMVCWDALLKVHFPDFDDRIMVKVVDFSAQGALLHSERIAVDGHHRVVTGEKPVLTLRILSPSGLAEALIDIRWYRWSHEIARYEVGVQFLELRWENPQGLDDLLEKLESHPS